MGFLLAASGAACGNPTNNSDTTSQHEPSCKLLRHNLLEATRSRARVGLNDPDAIRVVDKTAREARSAGCKVSDLVGDDVGR